MLVDGQTDMMTIIVAFRNFAKEPKKVISDTNTVKTTKVDTFWQFSNSQAFVQKMKTIFFSVINKTLHFDKHSFFQNKSRGSASSAIPSLYF
jgi:hypothetical protein